MIRRGTNLLPQWKGLLLLKLTTLSLTIMLTMCKRSDSNLQKVNMYSGQNGLGGWKQVLGKITTSCVCQASGVTPRVAHTWYRKQGCVIHWGIKPVGREPSSCRLNSLGSCSLLYSQSREQVNDVHIVVSPLWRGLGNIHGFILDGKSYRQG